MKHLNSLETRSRVQLNSCANSERKGKRPTGGRNNVLSRFGRKRNKVGNANIT